MYRVKELTNKLPFYTETIVASISILERKKPTDSEKMQKTQISADKDHSISKNQGGSGKYTEALERQGECPYMILRSTSLRIAPKASAWPFTTMPLLYSPKKRFSSLLRSFAVITTTGVLE